MRSCVDKSHNILIACEFFQSFFFLLSNLDKKTHKEINKFSWPLPFYMYTVIPSIQTNCTFQMLFQSLRAVRKLEVRGSPKKKMTYHFKLLCPSSTTWRIEIFIRMSCLPKITFIFFDVVDDNYTLGQNNFVQITIFDKSWIFVAKIDFCFSV